MTERTSADGQAVSSGPPLLGRAPAPGAVLTTSSAMEGYLEYIDKDLRLTPYPHQEEALLEVFSERHVILNTPTGSGKTLVATAMLFKAFVQGRKAWYTAPVKALVNEKFFDLCREFGADNVGMLTGDAVINADAPILCCTAEILANHVLRSGSSGAPDDVVMDEFHYYADRDRGWAWQVPLIALPQTTFMLMSATLGDMSRIAERLEHDTGRDVSWITSAERPVPLDWQYRETPLHETVQDLLDDGRVPAYVVGFTRAECNELAQSLSSITVADKPTRKEIGQRLIGEDLSTPFGKELGRILRHGIGIHHAGLLPRYRRLVERLAQDGLMRIVCGTDTLGVGVNIPIRTVVFTKLAKYDGQKVALLKVREFKQIAGRAGRKGFDEQGSVIALAPDHIIANKKIQQKHTKAHRKGKTPPKGRRKQPGRDEVTWSKKTFEQLIARPPEPLGSRFQITHGMLVQVLQRAREEAPIPSPQDGSTHATELHQPTPNAVDDPSGGYAFLVGLIQRNHDGPRRKARQLRRAADLFRGLRRAGIVDVEPDPITGKPFVRVSESLQEDFSLNQALSLWLVDAVGMLDPTDPANALNVLTLVEATLEHPWPIIKAQLQKAKSELVAELKSQRVPYDERMRQLDLVTHPQPLADFIHGTLNLHMEKHPWVRSDDVHPKSIAREMVEGYWSFDDYVRHLGIQRSEGILLRYIAQAWRTLVQNVKETDQTDEILDIAYFLRIMIEQVDASLFEEWERLRDVGVDLEAVQLVDDLPRIDLVADAEARGARIRAELHRLVQLIAADELGEAARALRLAGKSQTHADEWDAEGLAAALRPVREELGDIVFAPEARRRRLTRVTDAGPRRWSVSQTLVGPDGPSRWHLLGEVDLRELRAGADVHRPIVRLIDVTDLG